MKPAIEVLLFFILLLAAVEVLQHLHPAGAAKLLKSRTFRVFRFTLAVIVGASLVALVVIAVIFGGIAIIQDIGTTSGGGGSVNSR